MSNPGIYALAYASKANQDFDDAALKELESQAAEKNERLGVTGYLHYRQDTFFQYLEGEQTVVTELMARIADDDRHTVVNTVELGKMADRSFPTWSMRFLSAGAVSTIRMEDVLEQVLLSMSQTMYGDEVLRPLVLRLVSGIAKYRSRI